MLWPQGRWCAFAMKLWDASLVDGTQKLGKFGLGDGHCYMPVSSLAAAITALGPCGVPCEGCICFLLWLWCWWWTMAFYQVWQIPPVDELRFEEENPPKRCSVLQWSFTDLELQVLRPLVCWFAATCCFWFSFYNNVLGTQYMASWRLELSRQTTSVQKGLLIHSSVVDMENMVCLYKHTYMQTHHLTLLWLQKHPVPPQKPFQRQRLSPVILCSAAEGTFTEEATRKIPSWAPKTPSSLRLCSSSLWLLCGCPEHAMLVRYLSTHLCNASSSSLRASTQAVLWVLLFLFILVVPVCSPADSKLRRSCTDRLSWHDCLLLNLLEKLELVLQKMDSLVLLILQNS